MNNFKSILFIVLALVTVISICACNNEIEDNNSSEDSVVSEISVSSADDSSEEAETKYTVKVIDADGKPLSGVMVQLCKDACIPALTDANGIATFNISEDGYKATIASMPEGYTYYADANEYYFEEGETSLTITLIAQ